MLVMISILREGKSDQFESRYSHTKGGEASRARALEMIFKITAQAERCKKWIKKIESKHNRSKVRAQEFCWDQSQGAQSKERNKEKGTDDCRK